jgi:hypothetical protein
MNFFLATPFALCLDTGMYDVLVLEARDRIGGRVHTATIQGFRVDYGAAFVHGCDEDGGNPCNELAQVCGLSSFPTMPFGPGRRTVSSCSPRMIPMMRGSTDRAFGFRNQPSLIKRVCCTKRSGCVRVRMCDLNSRFGGEKVMGEQLVAYAQQRSTARQPDIDLDSVVPNAPFVLFEPTCMACHRRSRQWWRR